MRTIFLLSLISLMVITVGCSSSKIPKRFIKSLNERNGRLYNELVSENYFLMLGDDTTTVKSAINYQLMTDSIHMLRYDLVSYKKTKVGYVLNLVENDIFTKYCKCASPRQMVCYLHIEENKISSATFQYSKEDSEIRSCDTLYFDWLVKMYPQIKIKLDSIMTEIPFSNSESWVEMNRLGFSKVSDFCHYLNEKE